MRLTRASSLIGKIVSDSILPFGLTLGEYNFLRIVELNPRVTARDIQRELAAAAPSVAQMVARLEKKGFLKRDRSGDDGRMMHLRLTFWGSRAIKKGKAAIESALKDMKLNQKTLSTVIASLDSLIDSLGEAEETE